MAGGGEDDVDGVARGAGQKVAAEMAVLLHVADHRLDAGAPPDLASDGRRDAALLPGDEDALLVGIVAAVAALDIGARDRHAGDALEHGSESGAHRLGGAGNLAGNVANEAAAMKKFCY